MSLLATTIFFTTDGFSLVSSFFFLLSFSVFLLLASFALRPIRITFYYFSSPFDLLWQHFMCQYLLCQYLLWQHLLWQHPIEHLADALQDFPSLTRQPLFSFTSKTRGNEIKTKGQEEPLSDFDNKKRT